MGAAAPVRVVDPQGENAEQIDDIYPVIGPYLGLDGLTG